MPNKTQQTTLQFTSKQPQYRPYKLLYPQGSEESKIEWERKMWRMGYNYPATSAMQFLSLTRRGLESLILPNVYYVTYSNAFAKERLSKYDTRIFLKKDDFIQYVIDNATFERQTEVVDLYSYLYEDKQRQAEAFKLYNKIRKKSAKPGYVPEGVLKYINRHYLIEFVPKNINVTKRKPSAKADAITPDVSWKSVESFNFFECELIEPKNALGRAYETLYREAFRNGYVRVRLGNKKTWFVKKKVDVEKMKMPFLVPYGQKMRCRPLEGE